MLESLSLPPNTDLLDIGAGEGSLVHEVRRWSVGRTEGIDPVLGIGIHRGVAEAFDLGLPVRTLAHLAQPDVALREVWQVLRPGGHLVLAAHGAEHLRATWKGLGRPADDGGPEQRLRSALIQAGHIALRLDVRRPMTVTATDARELIGIYGLSIGVNENRFPVNDTAHLAVYIACETG